MKIHALARRYPTLVNRIESAAVIINPDTHDELATNGIWATGAPKSVITKKAAQKLKLPIREFTDVHGVGGLIPDVPVYLVDIRLNNENIVVRARVTECEDLSIDGQIDMLIGMNIIRQGDFAISNYEGKTTMTFRVPSLSCIDYVKEIEDNNRFFKIHEINVRNHVTDKCGCGSGKLYKNCHGSGIYNPQE